MVLQHGGTGDDWEFAVASINRPAPFEGFSVRVFSNGTSTSNATELRDGTVWGDPASLHINFTDADGGGELTVGDAFVLGNTEMRREYRVALIDRSDGSVVAEALVDT